MDLTSFIDSKKSPINFSWHGDTDCFERYRDILVKSLSDGTLNWKRDDNGSNFPINIKFQLKLIKYHEGLILSAGVPPCCSQIAFVHIYFFNVAVSELACF